MIRDINVAYQSFLERRTGHFRFSPTATLAQKSTWPYLDQGLYRSYQVLQRCAAITARFFERRRSIAKLIAMYVRHLPHAMNFDKVIRTVLRNDYERLQHHERRLRRLHQPSIAARAFDLIAANHLFRQRPAGSARSRRYSALKMVSAYRCASPIAIPTHTDDW